MRVLIEAKLIAGTPHLRLLDADTGALRLDWRLDAPSTPTDFTTPCCTSRSGIQQLFRQLFLLACQTQVSRPLATNLSSICLECDGCTPRYARGDSASLPDRGSGMLKT